MKTIARYLVAVLLAAAASSAYSQAPAVGRILVSNPQLDDPNFSETVVMIIFHDANIGTAGVFLNRPTWVDPAEAFPDVEALRGYDGALYLGGPVAPTDLWALLEINGRPMDGTQAIAGSIHVSLDPEILDRIDFTAENRPRVRLYAGRAEWGPGQLAEEIADGNWRQLEARPDYVFAENPQGLWERMPPTSDGVTAALN